MAPHSAGYHSIPTPTIHVSHTEPKKKSYKLFDKIQCNITSNVEKTYSHDFSRKTPNNALKTRQVFIAQEPTKDSPTTFQALA